MKRLIVSAMLFAGALSVAAGAKAQGFTDTEGVRKSVTPYVWAQSITGDATLGPITGDVDVPFSDLFENLNFAAMVEGEYWNGRWGILGNFNYAALADSRPGVIGAVSTDIKMTIAGAAVAYRFGPYGESDRPTVIDPYFGLRYTNLDVTLDLAGGAVSSSRRVDFVDPVIGARMISKVGDRTHLIAGGDIGGFGAGSDFTWQAYGLLGFSPKRRNDRALVVGYRALGQEISSGGALPLTVDVVYHGPFIGYTFKF